MNINTVFNAISLSSIYSSYGPPQQRDKESRRLLKFRFWLLSHDEKQAAEIAELKTLVADAELNALLDQEKIARLQAQVAELNAETNNIKYAAHMPDDYQYSLPTWINCNLYACYIGAAISPYLQELIESGKLRFPDSPAEKENIRLQAQVALLQAQLQNLIYAED